MPVASEVREGMPNSPPYASSSANPIVHLLCAVGLRYPIASVSNPSGLALPVLQDDPKQRRPDISFAKEALDWEPNVALEEGLKKTIDYFR